MTDFSKDSDEAAATSLLKQFGENISRFANHASAEEKQTLLRLLDEQHLLELLQVWRYRDRRKVSRKACFLSASYTVEGVVFKDVINNIGSDGAFMETSSIVFLGRVGQRVAVTISRPDQQDTIEVDCEVAWTDAGRVGLKFTETSQALREMIESL